MAVAVGGVFDQFLLCELKALSLTAACLVDGLTLFAPALGQVGQRVVGHLGRHGRNSNRLTEHATCGVDVSAGGR